MGPHISIVQTLCRTKPNAPKKELQPCHTMHMVQCQTWRRKQRHPSWQRGRGHSGLSRLFYGQVSCVFRHISGDPTAVASLRPLAKNVPNCLRRQLSLTACCSIKRDSSGSWWLRSMQHCWILGCCQRQPPRTSQPKSHRKVLTEPSHVPCLTRAGQGRGLYAWPPQPG